MQFSLYERFEAWWKLLCTRTDLTFPTPLDIAPPADIPADYPADVRALAERTGYFYVSYRATGGEAAGYVCLALNGERVPTWMELDGAEVPEDALYMFDGDLEGTGNAAWLVVRSGQPPLIVWSVEDLIRFDSAESYLTLGAKRGFHYGSWQRDSHVGLASISKSTDTPSAEIVAGLVARGATPEMAADLVLWLGGDAALLLPK